MTNNTLIYYFKMLVNTPLLVIKETKSKNTPPCSKATTPFCNHREVLQTEVINPNWQTGLKLRHCFILIVLSKVYCGHSYILAKAFASCRKASMAASQTRLGWRWSLSPDFFLMGDSLFLKSKKAASSFHFFGHCCISLSSERFKSPCREDFSLSASTGIFPTLAHG